LVQVTSHRKIKRRAVPLSSRLRSSALSWSLHMELRHVFFHLTCPSNTP
jgi:hypothetical protein